MTIQVQVPKVEVSTDEGVHPLHMDWLARYGIEEARLRSGETYRQTQSWRWGPRMGVWKWWGADGGKRWGYFAVVQAHWTYNVETDELINAWVFGRGNLRVQAMELPESALKTLEAAGVESWVINYLTRAYTFQDVLSLVRDCQPILILGRTMIIPYEIHIRSILDLPDPVAQRIQREKDFRRNSPIYIGYDIHPRFGGTGSALPSHAWIRLAALERSQRRSNNKIEDLEKQLTRIETMRTGL